MTTVLDICVQKVHRNFLKKGLGLKDWQKIGIKWMAMRERSHVVKGGFLCDDMGMGKTIQVVGTMRLNKLMKTLIIMPGSLINQWKEIINKLLPTYNVYVHDGLNKVKKEELEGNENPVVVLTTYGKSYRRINKKEGIFKTVLNDISWDRVVLDECHMIKNERSKRYKGVNSIGGNIKWCLTGTPIQNSIGDIISLFHYLGISMNKKISRDRLSEQCDKYILRRTKKKTPEIIEKLPKMEVLIHKVPFMTTEEKEFYGRVRGEVKEEFKSMKKIYFDMTAIFELILRLRQACIDPQMVLNGYNKKHNIEYQKWEGSRTKIQTIGGMIVEKKNERAIVFCHFIDEIERLRLILEEKGMRVDILDGRRSLEERREVIEKCKKEEIDILLVQINVGGVGLNLQMFNKVYFCTPNWNPAIEDQAIARSYRLGQDKPVTIHKIILEDEEEENTIEERILEIQQNKRNRMSDILEDEDLLHNGDICRKTGQQNKLSISDICYMLG
tara:strand:+ start:299 stop:1795 length:1497 start_codon:yes stop_codon:yes gene_type:complete